MLFMVPPGSGRGPCAMVLCCTLLMLCLMATARGQFHPDCTEEALRARCCCPVSVDGTVCGNGTKRGSCQRYQLRKNPPLTDTRCNWPYELFDKICACNGNYDGPDCGDCKPYYHGDNCSKHIPCVRKELRELTATEKKQFVEVLCLAKTTISRKCVIQTGGNLENISTYTFQNASYFDCLAATHSISTMYISINGKRIAKDLLHSGPAFCTGHRYLLLHLEQMMQKLSGNKSFCLPYWDWTKDGNTNAVFTDDLLGSIGPNGTILPPSCFSNWKIVCGHSHTTSFCLQEQVPSHRQPLTRSPPSAKRWPTAAEVNDMLKWPVYDRPPFNQTSTECFRSIIEGCMDAATGRVPGANMHKMVHGYVGGAMNSVVLASNDPAFYLHHAQLDRIYAMWQRIHCKTPADYPENDCPCQGPDDAVYPFIPPVAQKVFMNSPEHFGYSYSDKKHWPPPRCTGSSGVLKGNNTTSH